MFKISLRFPYLIYLSIASIMIGIILAPLFRDIPVQGPPIDMIEYEMQHRMLDIQAVGAPQIAIAVEKDRMSGWNVIVSTNNFSFTPELVNSKNIDNTGHAHLYVDGEKIARLYAPYFHIPHLPVGAHEVSVNLSSNDHSYYAVDGIQIEARIILIQDEVKMVLE